LAKHDIGTTGFLIERKDSTEAAYHFLDSITSALTLSYTDIKKLKPLTKYAYRLKSYAAKVVSDTSNHLEAVTLSSSLQKSTITLYWNSDHHKQFES
jgi:hypothetical protein